MPKPPIENEWCHYKIKYCSARQGLLNFVRYSNAGKLQIYIFKLKEDQSKWLVRHYIDGEKILRSYNTQLGPSHCFLSVLSFVHGEAFEGSYIVLYIPGHVLAYNFKDNTIRKLGDLRLDFHDQNALSNLGWTDVHQYFETFSHV